MKIWFVKYYVIIYKVYQNISDSLHCLQIPIHLWDNLMSKFSLTMNEQITWKVYFKCLLQKFTLFLHLSRLGNVGRLKPKYRIDNEKNHQIQNLIIKIYPMAKQFRSLTVFFADWIRPWKWRSVFISISEGLLFLFF